uniref:Uncharacterized protein n=1 Tax=Aegilops tauschii TaxID=37682 RepID=M8BDL4_AEGTA
MSTAVARPFGGFPGSGRTKGDELLGKKMSDGFFIEEEEEEEAEEVLTESSSIGAPSPSSSSIGEDSSSEVGGEGEDEEVESKLKEEPGLGCLDALEDSLPINSLATATYLPPLLAPDHALPEGDEGEEDDDSDSGSDEQHRGKNGWEAPALPPPRLSVNTQMGASAARRGGSFRSPRSYSLSDLRNGGDASYNQ